MKKGGLRFGILGCGGIATGIFPEISKGRGYRVVAAAASNFARARAFAKRFKIQAAGSYAALLARPDIDAVYVALPESLHAEWSIAAAKAGKHVLCEKTLAPDLKSAMALFAACRRNKVRLLEAFMWRFTRANQDFFKGARRLGAVRFLKASFCFVLSDRKNYRNFKKFGGGCLNDIGGYTLNAARQVLGEPVRVSCRLLGESASQADMHGTAWLEFRGGSLASLQFSFSQPFVQGLELDAMKGSLKNERPFVPDGRKSEPRYRMMFEAFSREVRRQPRQPGAFEREALAQARAMHALRLAAKKGRSVDVEAL